MHGQELRENFQALALDRPRAGEVWRHPGEDAAVQSRGTRAWCTGDAHPRALNSMVGAG